MGQKVNFNSLKKKFKYIETSQYLFLKYGNFYLIKDYQIRNSLEHFFKRYNFFLNTIYFLSTENKSQLILNLHSQKDVLWKLFKTRLFLIKKFKRRKKYLKKKNKVQKKFFKKIFKKQIKWYNRQIILQKKNIKLQPYQKLLFKIFSVPLPTKDFKKNYYKLQKKINNNNCLMLKQYYFKFHLTKLNIFFKLLNSIKKISTLQKLNYLNLILKDKLYTSKVNIITLYHCSKLKQYKYKKKITN